MSDHTPMSPWKPGRVSPVAQSSPASSTSGRTQCCHARHEAQPTPTHTYRLSTVPTPPGTCVLEPGKAAKKRAQSAIQPVAQEATRAQALDVGGLIGARRAPDRPASVATGTAGSAATLAAIPHTGTVPDRETMRGAVEQLGQGGHAHQFGQAAQDFPDPCVAPDAPLGPSCESGGGSHDRPGPRARTARIRRTGRPRGR